MTVKIKLHTEQNPEDNAMLQALYSRSADSVDTHLEKLAKTGSGKFMEQYYLNYGHASIADCGTVTIYIEGVSMLCAKAFQDDPLYQGQESSSRYIDWSEQPFYNPYPDPTTKETMGAGELLQAYRTFYVEQKPILIEHLKTLYPIKAEEKPNIYEKAITAKAFDILRGFLPCGATTNLSWSITLRKANENLTYLSRHPLKEVRDVARQVHGILQAAYPNSIAALVEPPEADPYYYDARHYYSDANPYLAINLAVAESGSLLTTIIDTEPAISLDEDLEFYNSRPKRASLPKHDEVLRKNLIIQTNIDFGSYRDLQRHRNGYCALPIVDQGNGFHPFYFNELPKESQLKALELFNKVVAFTELAVDNKRKDLTIKLNLQYFLPMGTLVPVSLTYNIHQTLYVAELRSSQTVHATLRPMAKAMGKYLEDHFSIKTYCDFSEDAWNIRRGNQDIVAKVNSTI